MKIKVRKRKAPAPVATEQVKNDPEGVVLEFVLDSKVIDRKMVSSYIRKD